jgi:mRNA-degrading endonuclease toxin of MazEF toxin-antitoxin module
MKRGDACTVAGSADYAGKPRPAVIVQDQLLLLREPAHHRRLRA